MSKAARTNKAAAFTPGPWSLYSGPDIALIVEGGDGNDVCNMVGGPSLGPDIWASVQADARLIAAAPDLYDACETAIQIIEQLVPEPSARGVADVVLFQLRAALAKAEGGAR